MIVSSENGTFSLDEFMLSIISKRQDTKLATISCVQPVQRIECTHLNVPKTLLEKKEKGYKDRTQSKLEMEQAQDFIAQHTVGNLLQRQSRVE
jgi:hypothetical protein